MKNNIKKLIKVVIKNDITLSFNIFGTRLVGKRQESFEDCNNVHILELIYEFISKDNDLKRAF